MYVRKPKRRAKIESTQIHTNIRKVTKERLITLGNGALNAGIERAVQIMDSKSAEIREVMLAITNDVIDRYNLRTIDELMGKERTY